jgi:hypothetical protein
VKKEIRQTIQRKQDTRKEPKERCKKKGGRETRKKPLKKQSRNSLQEKELLPHSKKYRKEGRQ